MADGLLTLLSLLGAVQGLVLAAALVAAPGSSRGANRVLAGMLTTGALAVAVIALSHRAGLEDARPLELVEAGLTFVMAPLSLLYARLVTADTVRPLRFAWHFAPASVWTVSAVTAVALQGAHGAWLPPVGALVAYQVAYTARAGLLLYRRWTATRPAAGHRFWSRAWIGLLLALHVAQGIRFAFPRAASLRDVVPLTLGGGFLLLTFAGFRHSTLFGARSPRAAAPRDSRDPRLRAVSARIREALEADRLYLDPSLTLEGLAARLELPRSRVSRAVNLGDANGFVELVNGYRVDEARRLLSDRGKDHLTIDAVARRAGFASRSAFYEAFRRHVDATPGEYRERAHREPPS
ncbi:MAG: AraC family transcriptional regulator [Thermoanaerobaculia bacterium]